MLVCVCGGEGIGGCIYGSCGGRCSEVAAAAAAAAVGKAVAADPDLVLACVLAV